MLRNSYLESYTQNKNISEFEKEMLAHDENHLLNLERPLSTRDIGKLPKGILPSFIDDIMCNNKINHLLYSSNANKELLFYLKQKKFLLKNTKVYVKRNPFISKKNRRPCESVFLKKKKAAMFQIIKENISEYKDNKSHSLKLLAKKNENFHKKQIKENKLSRKLFFKSINDIRLEGYRKAVEGCLDKSERNENFSIPDISFNINNVYSRLYHNAILTPIKLSEKSNNKIKTTNYNSKDNNISDINNNNEEKNNDINKTLFSKKISKMRKESYHKQSSIFNKKNNSKNLISEYNSYYENNKKRLPNFNLKKIINGYDGKEFTIKPSILIYQRCWSKNSGGPNIKKKLYKKILKNALNNNFSYSNDTNELIDVNSYRDHDDNNNLIISTKRNNVKFVQYFLDKNYNPNSKNKYGSTALHFAMKNNNKKIIQLLLDKHGDITIRNKRGTTPYDLASKEIKNEFKLNNIMLLKEPKKFFY